MQFSTADKSLYIKLVYYGPGLSGKTTNLESIHRLTDPRRRQPMVSLKTEGDRTLFFDLLPFDLGQLYGLNVRVKLYTVPGQIQYDTTRKQVLAGADGVVFVADSSAKQREANKVMLRYLRSNLQANGLDPEKIPLAFQWNKRDLPDAMPEDEMYRDLAWRQVPTLPAVATVGTGVMEMFREISVLTLESLARRAPSVGDRVKAADVRPRVEALFSQFIDAGQKAAASFPPSPSIGRTIGASARPLAADEKGEAEIERRHFGLDDLLSEAVETNLAFSERLVSDVSREQLLARVRRERKAVHAMAKLSAGAADPDAICRLLLRSALAGLELATGSVLRCRGPRVAMNEVAVSGRPRDPLNSVVSAGIGSVATALFDRGAPVMSHDPVGELLFGQPHPALDGLRGVLSIPVRSGRGTDEMLVLYAEATTRDLDADDAEFATMLVAIATLALRSMPVGTTKA